MWQTQVSISVLLPLYFASTRHPPHWITVPLHVGHGRTFVGTLSCGQFWLCWFDEIWYEHVCSRTSQQVFVLLCSSVWCGTAVRTKRSCPRCPEWYRQAFRDILLCLNIPVCQPVWSWVRCLSAGSCSASWTSGIRLKLMSVTICSANALIFTRLVGIITLEPQNFVPLTAHSSVCRMISSFLQPVQAKLHDIFVDFWVLADRACCSGYLCSVQWCFLEVLCQQCVDVSWLPRFRRHWSQVKESAINQCCSVFRLTNAVVIRWQDDGPLPNACSGHRAPQTR